MTGFGSAVAARPSMGGYDNLMYWPALEEYYGHSDFVNYGYWEAGTGGAREASENLMEKLLAFIPEKRGRILDVACGKGATSRYLLKYYASDSIIGINTSRKQLATCRKNASDCTFLAMDAIDLRWDEGTFDALICVESAFHFKTRERFFREAHRVLRPGGRLVLSDILLTKEAEARRPYRYLDNFVADPEEYAAVGYRAGFDEVQVVDATEPCFQGCFWHLVRFSHEKLLAREIDAAGLRAFCRSFFEFVPEVRYYLLAAMTKT